MSSPKNNMHENREQNDTDSEVGSDRGEEKEQTYERQDLFVIFTSERELRNIDQVRVKISQFTGIVIRTKTVGDLSMQNLVEAIEQDAIIFQQQQQQLQKDALMHVTIKAARLEMHGMDDNIQGQTQTPNSGVINLRFEDCQFSTKAVTILKTFLTKKQLVETLVMSKVEFQSPIQDFKDLVGGIQFSIKLRKVGFTAMYFDEEQYGKTLCHLLNDCRTLREFDCSYSEFFHPKVFFEMCQAFIGDKCRVNVFKMRGVALTQLEGKVIQFVLMKNKMIHTIDLSGCRTDNAENLEFFLQKLDKFSNIRYLTLDNMQPDLSPSLEILGEALSENTRLEVLIMRENRLKWIPYCQFWDNIKPNITLKKINVSKTDLSDRVLEKLCILVENPAITLVDLDLSRNQITDIGLAQLGTALCNNKSIKFLNLSQNTFRDSGLKNFVMYLCSPDCALVELSLMGNKINNDGIKFLAEFVKINKSLKMLDLGRNMFGDAGFLPFAQEMGAHSLITYLDISKNKDLDDEGSLVILAQQIAFNKCLQTLDLSGLRIRKPFLKQYFEPSLKNNCTLKYVIGKLTPDIIDQDLRINIQIQTLIEPCFSAKAKHSGLHSFDVKIVDPLNTSSLDMKDKDATLFDAALKYVRYRDIRQVDFSNMNLLDNHLYQIAVYLSDVPNLRSVTIDSNKLITDDGLTRIADSLIKNNKLAHLSFKDCPLLTVDGLKRLNEVVSTENTVIFAIEFHEKGFDQELSKTVRFEAQLNRAIQEHLKPVVRKTRQNNSKQILSQTTISNQQTKNVDEVEFCAGAPVVENFSAAIKCWRIRQPLMIQIQDMSLEDKHVIELCDFLKDKNMITRLNLKRNKITNVGAKVIANWISDFDQTLTSIDLSRNKITRAGGEALLTVLKKTTRIIDFQIAYGNPIPLTTQLAIGSEIIANNQIKTNQSDNRKNRVSQVPGRYELTDKGPIFMRCAIKSVELLRIRHLSLPDNMLGHDEAKMIAAMIKVNPPLRTLNLELNNLDAECGKLIADALKFNSNLAVLNISKNKLSDLGVTFLLRPLIKARLHEMATQKKKTPIIQVTLIKEEHSEQQVLNSPTAIGSKQGLKVRKMGGSNPASPISSGRAPENQKKVLFERASSDRQHEGVALDLVFSKPLPTEEIEREQMSQLKIINIMDNMTTLESYKSIWTLLEINPNVVIYFDSNSMIQTHNKAMQDQRSKKDPTADTNQDDLSARVAQADPNSALNRGNDLEAYEKSQLNQSHSHLKAEEQNNEDLALLVATPRIKNQQNRLTRSLTRIMTILCCYKDRDGVKDGPPPSLAKVLSYPVTNSKQKALNYKPNIEKYAQIDRSSIQKSIQTLLLVKQIGMNLCIIIPIILEKETAGLLLAAYTGLMLAGEAVIVLFSKTAVSISIFNFYLYIQFMCGILRKASLLGLALFSGLCIRSHSLVGIIVGVIGIILILCEQFLSVQQIRQDRKVDSEAVLPNIECTQRLAELMQFKGLNLVYQQITLMPSVQSMKLSETIAQELNPDLIKAPPVGFYQKLKHFVLNRVIGQENPRHILLIDLPIILVGVICLAGQWTKLDLVFIIVIIVFLVDITVCILNQLESQAVLRVDSSNVYQISNQRIHQLATRYTEVLNREAQAEEQHKQDSPDLSDESIFETKGSEFNTLQELEQQTKYKPSLKLKTNLEQMDNDNILFEEDGQKTEPPFKE